MRCEVRRAITGDGKLLANIIVESWRSAYSAILPCSLVFANKDNDEQLEECGSIYSIYLLEEYWGNGLVIRLMNEIISILKRKDVRRSLYGFMKLIQEQDGFPINLLN